MKYLIGFIGFLLITSTAFADEIIMSCKSKGLIDNVTLKYSSSLFGKSVKRRMKGQWVEFCTYENQTLKVGDKSAICSFPKGFTTTDYVWSDDGKTRSKTTYRGEWVFDFLKVTFDENTTWENHSQNPNQPIKSRKGFKCVLL